MKITSPRLSGDQTWRYKLSSLIDSLAICRIQTKNRSHDWQHTGAGSTLHDGFFGGLNENGPIIGSSISRFDPQLVECCEGVRGVTLEWVLEWGKAWNSKSQGQTQCHSLCLLSEEQAMALSYILSTMWLCTTMIPAMMMRIINPLKLEAPKLDTSTLRVALVIKPLVTPIDHFAIRQYIPTMEQVKGTWCNLQATPHTLTWITAEIWSAEVSRPTTNGTEQQWSWES